MIEDKMIHERINGNDLRIGLIITYSIQKINEMKIFSSYSTV